MNLTGDPDNRKDIQYKTIGSKVITVGGEVGCLTLIIVFAAVFGGLALDRIFGTKPLLTIFFVVASAPLSLALTFWIAKRAVASVNTPPTAVGETKPSEGDNTGD